MNEHILKVGDQVIKTKGDYIFQGVVVAVFTKVSGVERVVVENQDKILHIFSPNQLEFVIGPESK